VQWQSVEPVERVVKSGFVRLYGDDGHSFHAVVVVVVVAFRDRRAVVGGGQQAAVARLGVARSHRVGGPDVGDVDERLVHKDDRDEDGEALLREASDVADKRAEVERDGQQQEQRHPHADPQTKR